ncbi:CHRD domain-containing protein [Crocosphaera subtropica]|uniref:CHRD domain-containing protein n=1 Tax=Crocosphaera subtropica TaxID=2546360 RepID=UPI001FB023B3|nr:CHRD domain-containing protein [Crocosphaera subtropica]
MWYINIHTEANPPGEIRGQVNINTIPEPFTLGLLGMAGVTFLGYQLRKKRLG